MPNLLLEKLSLPSKAKDNLKSQERKLECWKQGNLNELFYETMTIQKSLEIMSSLRNI